VMNFQRMPNTTARTKRVVFDELIPNGFPFWGAWRCSPDLELADQITEPAH